MHSISSLVSVCEFAYAVIIGTPHHAIYTATTLCGVVVQSVARYDPTARSSAMPPKPIPVPNTQMIRTVGP